MNSGKSYPGHWPRYKTWGMGSGHGGEAGAAIQDHAKPERKPCKQGQEEALAAQDGEGVGDEGSGGTM